MCAERPGEKPGLLAYRREVGSSLHEKTEGTERGLLLRGEAERFGKPLTDSLKAISINIYVIITWILT